MLNSDIFYTKTPAWKALSKLSKKLKVIIKI